VRRWLPWLLLAVAAPLHAADVDAWLARIGPALRGLDYEGTLVYSAGGRLETMRVYHREDGGRERERLVAVSGAPREVVRDGDRVMCIGTSAGAVAYADDDAGRWSGALALSRAARLRGYRAALADTGRVAGHAAQVIEIRARDDWRYGHRLWLAVDSGLPLRVDLLDAAGRTIEQVAFAELRLVEPADADLRPSPGARPVAMSPAPVARTSGARWHVPVPPPGFALRATRETADGVQLLYSDGLASVSVYVERAGDGVRGATTSRRGSVHARAYWVDGWRVLAIGKVPLATVDRFARTVRAVPADG
jgi:sigma-E factor negative regulatory protein RseB